MHTWFPKSVEISKVNHFFGSQNHAKSCHHSQVFRFSRNYVRFSRWHSESACHKKNLIFNKKLQKSNSDHYFIFFVKTSVIHAICIIFTLLWFSWNQFHFSLFQKFTMKGNSRFFIFWKCVSNFIKIYIFCVFFKIFSWKKRWEIGCSKQKSKTCFSSLKNIFFLKFVKKKILTMSSKALKTWIILCSENVKNAILVAWWRRLSSYTSCKGSQKGSEKKSFLFWKKMFLEKTWF